MSAKQNLVAWSVVLLLGGVVTLSASPARAGDPLKEAAMASQHAGLAAKAPDAKTTEMHFHHVINCLVGPGGDGYLASEANPCKDLGAGGIPDAATDAQKKAMRLALRKSNSGLKYLAKDFPRAQRYAVEAQAALAPIVVSSSK